jgi:hypothetical protein
MLITSILQPIRLTKTLGFGISTLKSGLDCQENGKTKLGLVSYKFTREWRNNFPELMKPTKDGTVYSFGYNLHNPHSHYLPKEVLVPLGSVDYSLDNYFMSMNPKNFPPHFKFLSDKIDRTKIMYDQMSKNYRNLLVFPEYFLNKEYYYAQGENNQEIEKAINTMAVAEGDYLFLSALLKRNIDELNETEVAWLASLNHSTQKKVLWDASGPQGLSKNITSIKSAESIVLNIEKMGAYKRDGMIPGYPFLQGDTIGSFEIYDQDTGKSIDCLLLMCADMNEIHKILNACQKAEKHFDSIIFIAAGYPLRYIPLHQIEKLFKSNGGSFIIAEAFEGSVAYNYENGEFVKVKSVLEDIQSDTFDVWSCDVKNFPKNWEIRKPLTSLPKINPVNIDRFL